MAIRRAKGEYVLSTNADILLHPFIIQFITKKLLDKKCYYRTDRLDYKNIDFYDFDNPYATLQKIQQKVFRLMLKGYAYEVSGENFSAVYRTRLENSWRIFLDLNPSLTQRWEMDNNYEGFVMNYHTHCSGDFMLMHRDNWFNLRGYPEDTYISTHCDAIFTVMSSASGLKETVLQWTIYHQDHERRFNTDFDESKNNQDIATMFKRFLDDTREMIASGEPKIVNPPDWGFASENFKETII
jgi:hypothetical protein